MAPARLTANELDREWVQELQFPAPRAFLRLASRIGRQIRPHRRPHAIQCLNIPILGIPLGSASAADAVSLAVDLVIGWTRKNRSYAYLVYDGNEGTLTPSKTLIGIEKYVCKHFGDTDLGDPVSIPL